MVQVPQPGADVQSPVETLLRVNLCGGKSGSADGELHAWLLIRHLSTWLSRKEVAQGSLEGFKPDWRVCVCSLACFHTWSLSCVSLQHFHCWKTSANLSRPAWWKCRILYWLSLLAMTNWPLVQASSLQQRHQTYTTFNLTLLVINNYNRHYCKAFLNKCTIHEWLLVFGTDLALKMCIYYNKYKIN